MSFLAVAGGLNYLRLPAMNLDVCVVGTFRSSIPVQVVLGGEHRFRVDSLSSTVNADNRLNSGLQGGYSNAHANSTLFDPVFAGSLASRVTRVEVVAGFYDYVPSATMQLDITPTDRNASPDIIKKQMSTGLYRTENVHLCGLPPGFSVT
ncbi:2og-fe oxygenase [Moniliophthora roreri]|nr:2og-fe oxygenase [Moniliophthora roreri]